MQKLVSYCGERVPVMVPLVDDETGEPILDPETGDPVFTPSGEYTQPDGSPIIEGFVDLTADEIAELEQIAAEAAIVTTAQVNAERERRILAGTTINGVYVTGDETNRSNLSDLAFGVSLRIGAGDTTTLTTFRDGNNADHDLAPLELLSLWQQAAAHVSLLYAKSWALKAMDPIPADYQSDAYWSAE